MFESKTDDPATTVPTVSQPTREALDRFAPIYTEEYSGFKEDFISWLSRKGKKPFKSEGYAADTVETTHYKVEQMYRWKWRQSGGFTKEFTPDDAEAFTDKLVAETTLEDREVRDFIKAIKRLFSWFNETRGTDYDWAYSKLSQLEQQGLSKRRHYFEEYELSALYDAAVEYGSMQSYHSVTPDERSLLKTLLAERFGKSKSEIGPEDFDAANSWKFPSLVAMSIDLGLRPIEIERSSVDWLRLDEQKVVIPRDESSKGEAVWECVLSPRAKRALRQWRDERRNFEKYDNTDALWLTRFGNPYSANSLNGLLDRLLERTKIKPRNRDLSWYSIRRGAATMWANNSGLEQASEQLRHKQIETTLRYTKGNTESRKDTAADNW